MWYSWRSAVVCMAPLLFLGWLWDECPELTACAAGCCMEAYCYLLCCNFTDCGEKQAESMREYPLCCTLLQSDAVVGHV